jgi:hypothetical protein
MKAFSLLFVVWTMLIHTWVAAEPLSENNTDLKVQIQGDQVSVDLSLLIPAPRPVVWAVLTDFEHMTGFISNLKECRIISKSDKTATIFQRGTAQYGPVSFSFESTKELQFSPYDKITSHMISGNMSKLEGMTRLVDEGVQTRIFYHSDSIPGKWIPPLVGKVFIKHEILEQFQEVLNEIMKRKQVADFSGTPVASDIEKNSVR